jgi:hypothetical protein
VVEALQALQGVQFTVVMTLVAELSDLTRVENPRQLMKYLGLISSEYSGGKRRRQGSITKAGNTPARRALVVGSHNNARPELPPEAGARHERTLEAVSSGSLIRIEAPATAYRCGMLALGTRHPAQEEEISGNSPRNNTRFTAASSGRPPGCLGVS